MATLREYFDGDFGYAAKVCIQVPTSDPAPIEARLMYDFSAFTAFLSCYVPGTTRSLPFFLELVEAMRPEKGVLFDGRIVLPSTRAFPGALQVFNTNPFEMRAQFYGDPQFVSTGDIKTSSRAFIYSESPLSAEDLHLLTEHGRQCGLQIQFRSMSHAQARSKSETPLAFISHDSRDKATIARPIATRLQKMLCPVWYDEFSLKVGDNLRESIEKGLTSSKKCILVLSKHFLANAGWPKKEFDSVFTREILEKQTLVLPIWAGVSKEQVYEYSPSLLNLKGLSWDDLGEEEICRQLYGAILDQPY